MNLSLKKEIISHIFKTLGIIYDANISEMSMFEKFNTEKFLITKKLVFKSENSELERNIWAVTTDIENSRIKIIIADISEDIREFTLLFQMDNMIAYAIRLSDDPEDTGSMYICVDNKTWIEASSILQAKMLVGIESLSEMYTQWKRLDDYQDMYKILVGFLNFHEQE